MRILSDFDGVWTRPARRGRGDPGRLRPRGRRSDGRRRGAGVGGVPRVPPTHPRGPRLPRMVAARVPLGSFVDEDESVATGAVGRWLDHHADLPGAERALAALHAAGHERAEDLVNQSFGPAMRAYRDEESTGWSPKRARSQGGWQWRGIELVIVSNSPTEKLRSMFAAEGSMRDRCCASWATRASGGSRGPSPVVPSTAERSTSTGRATARSSAASSPTWSSVTSPRWTSRRRHSCARAASSPRRPAPPARRDTRSASPWATSQVDLARRGPPRRRGRPSISALLDL